MADNDSRPEVPLRLKAALDVDDEEYTTAKRSRSLLWILTGIGMALGVVSMAADFFVFWLPIMGPLATPIITGVATHIIAALVLKDARKMSTNRMRSYPELKMYLRVRDGNSKTERESD